MDNKGYDMMFGSGLLLLSYFIVVILSYILISKKEFILWMKSTTIVFSVMIGIYGIYVYTR